jgi:hypothetical protein
MREVRYKDLSGWMKAGIIGGFISLGSFVIGFIYGLAGF